MRYSDLHVEERAPHNGQLLAYTRRQVLFKKYANLDEVKTLLDDQELLEVHLFDKNKEYRAVTTKGKRKFDNCNNGVIEHESYFEDNEKEIYKEAILLEHEYTGYRSIIVLNHIKYDERGMAKIDDYRLIMEEQE